MYHPNRILERELEFTKIYRENIGQPKAVRESRCMDAQMATYFVTIQPQDLIAGRISRPYVVFAQCMEGDGIDKTGYCIDVANCEKELKRMKADDSYSREDCMQAEEMIQFWKTENTNTKIRQQFPKSWAGSMGGDDYVHDNAAIHPLYRLAGVNLDFKKLFRLGVCGLRDEALRLAQETQDSEKKNFYEGVASVQESLRRVMGQYTTEAKRLAGQENDRVRQQELLQMAECLEHIQTAPPESMQEAIQLQCLYMLAARAVEIGRIDDYLGEFYRKDLKTGRITHDQAVRLLDNFFTIIETQCGRDTRVIIGGMGREHEKSADEFAMLVMDVLEVRREHFYPQISLRYYKEMNQDIYDRALRILGSGMTFPMLYNDDVNVPAVMRAMDVPRKAAEQYSFFGCGEYMLAVQSIGTPNTALNVAKVLELVLHDGINPATGILSGPLAAGQECKKLQDIICYEELEELLKTYLTFFIEIAGGFEELVYDVDGKEAEFLQLSCLQDDCMTRGRGMLNGGYRYLGGTVETYGNITLSDSMEAIRKVVFEEKRCTLQELVEALDCDFSGKEMLQQALLDAPKFGNDNEEADEIAVRLHEFICQTIRNQKNRTRLDSFLAVLINNNMNVTLGQFTGATPDGRNAHKFLSNGNSPYNGQDKEGLTALILSLTKLDNSIHAGGNQNLKFARSMFEGDLTQIKSVLGTFFDLGGQQVNLSVVCQKDLEDALVHPESHENLVVRVGGFTARFIDLDKKTQQDVLTRTAYC